MELQAMVDAAIADVADRLGLTAEAIEVVEARAVTWPDSSLGCPEPGMSYMQVLTPGYLVRLHAAGESHHYHSGPGGRPVLCPPGRQTPPLPGAPRDAEHTNGTS